MLRLAPTAAPVIRIACQAKAFTLVELLVVLVIVAILSALSLAGLAGVRDRSKADKTRSTIRKLNDIIVPQFESYLSRRVTTSGSFPQQCVGAGTFTAGGTPVMMASGAYSAAINRLWAQRLIMTLEMPDQWNDVMAAGSAAVPLWTLTTPVRRYARYKNQVSPDSRYESAECLAMIVMRGGMDADAIEGFRADEIGDIDKDGAAEFHDGWGRPIAFIRWPAGFKPLDPSTNPDPFDPMRVASPLGSSVEPLIYSPGPDESLNDSPGPNGILTDPISSKASGYGLVSSGSATPGGWVSPLVTSGSVSRAMLSTRPGSTWAGAFRQDDPTASEAAARDNITNHDFSKR
jgi:prepilin-type N-terminal cleavage/methylation domain-containing protein